MTIQDVIELLYTGGTFEASGPPVDYPSREVERKAIEVDLVVGTLDGADMDVELVSAYQVQGRIVVKFKELP
jgi:hypothetical protein